MKSIRPLNGLIRAMDPQVIAFSILIFGFLLPMAHVAFSPSAGPWRMPPEARCPFSPRVGWLVIVMLLGPIGWVMFMTRRRGRR